MKAFHRVGKVLSKDNNTVKISLPAAGACGTCSAKSLCGEATGRTIEVEGSGLQPGESCRIDVPGGQGLWAALLAFGIPTAFLFVGVFLSKALNLEEGFMALWGFAGVLLGLFLLWILNPLWKKWFPLAINSLGTSRQLNTQTQEELNMEGVERV